jgi:hypothetical protein
MAFNVSAARFVIFTKPVGFFVVLATLQYSSSRLGSANTPAAFTSSDPISQGLT